MSRRGLDEATHARITSICEEANAAIDAGDLLLAGELFHRALGLVPPPLTQWDAAIWLLTALGDVLFLQGRFVEAHGPLVQALACPGAAANPFIHLRLGQTCLEIGDEECANDHLARAYMAGGDEIFDDEDPKYHAHIRALLRTPRHN